MLLNQKALCILSYFPSFFCVLFFNVTRKLPVVTKTGKRRVPLAKGAAASLLSSASKLFYVACE